VSRIRRLAPLVLVAAVAALVLSACGSPAPAQVAAPGVPQRAGCGTVRLAVNPWVGYQADVAVISYLLRHELSCTVQLKSDGEVESWKHLAAGQVDAILEVWGHDDLKKQYIDKQKIAVEAGLTGNTGVLGWYVPPWMAKEYPDITDYKNLNKYADLFKTSKTGSKGQLLDGDPTYVTNDKALIKNLHLNYTVQYAGSEDKLIAAFRDAEANHTALLGYFYSPQWLLSEIPLAPVELPAYTPGCDADPATVKCGYQPYALDKVASKQFAYSGSPAYELIKNFQWTNADQNQVAGDITNKMPDDAAAKKWLDAHTKVWQAWMPSPS
jgi:glycine betaine/proline transport system substrate-binding protein